ncbi:unnamed protein product [Prunus armeniaca]|uniref:Uncharacterized protein n=1 Tax=Prunus armeniaca TaxID=36596 RepID=A0A6J5UND5_PRUAR|nr:unnamed protein product [Prunus armeniaca]CAB4305997.1 unnamed protein product [Prunus armeniaca]
MESLFICIALRTMGNCLHVLCHPPQEKIKVVIFKGGVREFKASTPIKEITSGPYIGYKLVHHIQPYTPLPPNTKLEPGEVYHIVPNLASLGKPLVPSKIVHQESCKRQKIKIVVTREQLELLLKSANKFRSPKEIGVQLSGRSGLEGSPKWRPSLAIIPEVHSF